jgi:hypothetical protein
MHSGVSVVSPCHQPHHRHLHDRSVPLLYRTPIRQSPICRQRELLPMIHLGLLRLVLILITR